MADLNSPYSRLDHEALNKQSVYDPSSVVERLRVASQKHEDRVRQRELENIEGLKRLQAKKEEQKSLINQLGSLGTDSDAIRTLTGSAIRGTSDAALGTLAWGAEALAQATDNPDFAESADSLREKNEEFAETSNSILESRNLDVLKAVAESTPTGDLDKPETWSLGDDPSAKGYGYQMLGILGEFAPQAAGLLAKSPKLAATIMGGIGAGQAGTAQGREARDYVLSQDISTLQEESEAFREMLADNPGMDPSAAKQQLAELAGLSAFGAGAAVGGAGGVATGYILKSLPKVLEGSRVTRMGKTGVLSGFEEGTQEVGEGAAATLASSAVTGLEQDPLEGSFGEAVLGAGFGTGLGTTAGAVNEVERKVQEMDEANQERLATEREQNVGIISAINEGRFEDLTNPENREQFPRTTVATALGKVAMDSEVDAQARQKANEALATLETETAQELQVEQERLQANGTLKTLKEEAETTKKKVDRLEKHIAEKAKAGESEESLAGFQAMLEQLRDNDLPAIEGQIDLANQSDGKRVTALQDELTSIGELRRNATVETTRSTDVSGLMSQAMDVSSSPEIRSQSSQQLVSTVRSNPDALSADQLKQLASPSNNALTDSDRKFLRQLAAAKVQENSLKSMDDVASDIYKDQGNRGYISLPKYKSLVGAAMQKGDVEGARQSLSMLENFMTDHKAKADYARKAFKQAQATGKQQALVADRSAPDGWQFRDKGRLWSDMKLRENGGLSIHRGSENLVNKIAKEAQVITSMHAALKAAVDGVDVTPSQSTSDTTAQPEAVSEAPEVTSSKADDSEPRSFQKPERYLNKKERTEEQAELKKAQAKGKALAKELKEASNAIGLDSEKRVPDKEKGLEDYRQRYDAYLRSPEVWNRIVEVLSDIYNNDEGARHRLAKTDLDDPTLIVKAGLTGQIRKEQIPDLNTAVLAGLSTSTDVPAESTDAQSESQTEEATSESPARTEEAPAAADPVTERADTTSEPASTVLTGRVMKGTDPSTLKPVVLAKVHQQVATKFGELQRQAYESGQVPAELETYRNDLQLIAQTVMKDSPASLTAFFELLVSSDTGVTQAETFAWAKNYADNEAQLDLLGRLENHPQVQNVSRVLMNTVVSEAGGQRYKPSAAFFPGETMTIGYDPSMVSSHGNSVEFVVDGIIHENIHAVSYDLINTDPALNQEIKDISGIIGAWMQDETNRQKLSDPAQFEYAISDENQQELLSTLLGSPRLMADLQLIPDPDGKQSLLDKFMSALKAAVQKAFPDITPKEVSLLDRVLRVGEEVLQQTDTPTNTDTQTDTTPEPVEEVKTASSPVYWFQDAELIPIDGQMTYDEIRSPINKMAYFTVSTNRALTKERDFLTSTLNRAKGDLSVLAPFIRGGTERLEKLAQKEDLNAFLDTVLSHMQAFNSQIDALFVNSPDKDKFGNPLSYLADPETGKLDENTKTAISQAALSFVLENGNEVWSNATDRQLRSVLHLTETDAVDPYAKRVVMNAGRRQASVIQELGRKAYQASGLKLLPNAPQNEAQQITNAMGEMALAVLFSKTEASTLPYLQRYEIPNFAFDKELREKVRSTNLHIRGSKNHKNLNKEEAALYSRYLAKHYFVRSNRLMDEYNGTEFTKNSELEQLKELARGTQNFLDDVFGVEYTRILPTLAPADFEQKKAKNSPGSVPSELAKAVDTDNKRAIKLDADLLSTEEGRVGIFHRMSRELIGLIAGKEDTTGRAIHKINRDGIRGKNEAIDREISLLLDDTMDLVEGDVNTPFYTQKTVWKMHRVGHSSNGFNAQNSKLHRYSAHLDGWEYEVNTKDPSDRNHQEFKLALLDALGVKTDDASPEVVAARFETEILGNESLMAAVPVMTRLMTDQDFALNDVQSPEAQALMTAMNEAGEGAHSFAGLVNLAKYLEAKKGPGVFTSTLSREGDGKNNGPIISNLMMGLPADRAEQNELMNMGGLFTSGQKYKNYGEYAEKVGKDLYKRLAGRANEGMQTRVNGIDKPEEFLPLRLLHTVIGNFVDDEGNVTKAGRNAVKQPLTSMIFGAGVKGTIDNMADDFVTGIYTLFEQAHNDPRQTQALVNGLNDVMEFANRGRKRPMSPNAFTLDPNNRNFLNQEFNESQETLLASVFHEFMGGEIKLALEEQYGEFLQTRSAMNDAANMTFRYYNLAYQEERKKMLADIQAKTGNDYQDLTAEQEKELNKRVSKLFPMMHTAFSKASGQSHRYGLPLLKQRRVQADENNQYTVNTKFNGLKVPSYRGVNDTGTLADVKSLKAEGVRFDYVEPGAGTVVLATHSTDTYPAASVYSKFSALNSHDAVHGPAPMMPEMIQHMNKSFFDAMVNVSITENIMDALFRTMDEFSVWEADFVAGMSSADRQAWENTKAWEIAPRDREYAKDGSFIELPSDLTPEEHAREWLNIAAEADRNRLAFLSRVGLVSQYYVGGGDFKVSGKQRQELREKLEKRDLVRVITDRRAQRLTRDPVLILEEMDKLQASVTEAMMDKASKIDPEDALILDRLSSALKDAQGNLNIALGMVFPGPMARDIRDHWRKVVTGTLGKRLYLEYTGQLSEVRQQAQPKQLAQYRSGSSSNVKNYTTQEVLSALGKQDSLNPGQAKRLTAVMASVVNNLHGPFGAKKAAVEAKSGETPVDLLIRGEQEGVYPFTSKAAVSGLKLTASERFVMEQVELTMRDAFDGKSMADKEIVKLFREARNTVKPQDLYAGDWSQATQAEIDAAKQAHAFIFRLDTDIGDTRSTHLSRFVALGLTYPPLQQALDFPLETVPSLKGEKAGDYLMYGFERMSQKAGDEINKTYSGQRANQRMEALVTRLVYNEKKQKLNILKQMDDVVEQLETATETAREAVKEKVLKTVTSEALTGSKYRTVRTGAKLTAILAEDRADELLKTLENFRNHEFRKKPLGFFMSTLNEVRGETTETEGFYEALAKVGQIEQERKNILENLRKEVLERFEDHDLLTEKEKAAVTQLFLRTDISALQDTMKAEEILGLMEDDAKMEQKIQALTKEVVTNNRFAGEHMYAIKDLAYYLATGKNVSENLAFNAHNIANLYGTNKARFAQSSDALVKSIDQLTSLYAFKYSDQGHKQAIRNLFQREKMRGDQNGLVYLMTFHKGMKADAQKELFGGNPTQMMKGYTKEIYNPHTQVVTADWAEGEKLIARGYERKSPLEMDDADPEKHKKGQQYLYVIRDAGLQDYVTGVLSNTGMQAKGSAINRGTNVGNAEGLTNWKEDRLIRVQRKKGTAMSGRPAYRADYDPSKQKAGKLAPVFDDQGNVANYRYLMEHRTKDALLNRDNKFEDILASTAASQYDKLASAEHNREVIGALYAFYKQDYAGNANAFVEVSEDSSDPSLREAYRLLPDATREAVQMAFGQDKLFIRNDMLDLILGYRKHSMSSWFNRNDNENSVAQNFLVDLLEGIYGKKAALQVRQAEDMWQATVKLVKDVWVIRNFTTLLGNVISNTTLLLAYGVPARDIISGHREAIDGLLRYQTTRNKLLRVQANQKAGVGDPDALAEQVRELEFDLQRNPVHELVDAGMFQTIMEDIDAEKDDYRYMSKFDRTLEDWAGKLPEPVRKTGEVLTVGHNTTMYKILFKGTQMSDFVGRYVLYNHLSNRKSKPLTKDQILKKTREAFINYDVPSHRSMQYANDMGLVFFTKYYMRIQKVIWGIMQESPARALGVVAASNYIGGLPTIFNSSMVSNMGDNPFDVGAINITDITSEPLPLKMLLSFLD